MDTEGLTNAHQHIKEWPFYLTAQPNSSSPIQIITKTPERLTPHYGFQKI